MNRVILIGRLTKDPELRTTSNGTDASKFTLAVTRNFTDANGEKKSDFINCIAWRKNAENLCKYCSKGSQILVEGRIQIDSYKDKNGEKKYSTNIIAENITFLNYNTPCENDSKKEPNTTIDPFKDFGEQIVITEDDLPF